ncbi:ABC transporter ATP-binding protein [Lacibacter sp. MH-610]|uniref:ATP-binding cassette domain-containing protein n=1 Tax=Lacibacter sp. MH-610 TaxID=3020883 RepID=UPI0038919748
MIEIHNLKKLFKDKIAVNIPSAHFMTNANVCIMGNNGAGKTTLLRLICNLLSPTEGYVNYTDFANKIFDSRKVAAFLDESFLFEYLTVSEYFELIISINDLDKIKFKNSLKIWEAFFDYQKNKNVLISNLSVGNRNKVGILSAILQNKPLLILDEPFANIDPSSQNILLSFFKENKKSQSVTILLSSHNIDHSFEIADQVILLENGAIIQNSTDILNSKQTILNYFNK